VVIRPILYALADHLEAALAKAQHRRKKNPSPLFQSPDHAQRDDSPSQPIEPIWNLDPTRTGPTPPPTSPTFRTGISRDGLRILPIVGGRRTGCRPRFMIPRLTSSVFVIAVLAAACFTVGAAAQAGAKALFYSAPASTTNPFAPVGIRFWFEIDGKKFTDIGAAAVGARIRLHIKANTAGFLTAWVIDANGEEFQVTPMEGRYAGYRLSRDGEFVAPAELEVPSLGSNKRLLILFARSQTEQVGTASRALEKIRRLSNATAPDGAPSIVRETDSSTPDELGVYVVHREGAQPGVEIDLGR
jgi:hypothetical protein